MNRLLFCLLFTLNVLSIASSSPIYRAGDTLHVLATSGLRLRDEPGGGKVLASLPYGTSVVARQPHWEGEELRIEGIKGRWRKVDWKGAEGYVFDGYMSVFPAPIRGEGNIKGYADRFFTKSGPPFQKTYGDEETFNTVYVQHYTYKNIYIQYKSNSYYEGGDERLYFDPGFNCSFEELLLLSKALFRTKIQESVQRIKAGPSSLENVEESILGSGVLPDLQYYNRTEENACHRIDFQLFGTPCFDSFLIGIMDYTAYLGRSGGC
jgi:hypothetical protein